MSKEFELAELLERLFVTPERLERFLYALPLGRRAAPKLPKGSSVRSAALEVVDELRRRGLIDADFFERLIEERPNEAQLVRDLQSRWLVDVDEWTAVPASEKEVSAPAAAPTVLVSYSRRDIDFFEELAAHLAVLQRKGKIELWHEGRIRAGDAWDEAIKRQVEQAEIFILLVSPEFLSSDFVWEQELPEIVKRHEKGEAIVLPVIVRPCAWQDSPIAAIQVLPSNGVPVALSSNPDRVWVTVTRYVEKAVREWRARK